jgi:hypothetical protein
MTVGGNNYVFVAGGTTPSTAQNKTYRYDIAGNTWTAVADMPSTRWGGASGIVNGLWVLAGGYVNGNPSTSAVAYDPNTNTWTLLNSNMMNPRGRGAGASTGTALFHIGGRNDTTFNGTTDNQRYLPTACPILNRVVSRATHGGAGTFDIDLTSGSGIECRSGGPNSDYTMVFTFSNPITSCGVASSGTASTGPNPNQCTVQLTGVPNQQYTTVQLTGVIDNNANTVDAAGTMGVLVGDVNGSKRVDAADVSLVRQQTLQNIDMSNFREDINASGRIDAADVSIARQQTLTSLP